MAKQWLRISCSEIQVGDLIRMSTSMTPTDRFNKVTQVTKITPYAPFNGAMLCDLEITCGKQGTFKVPSSHRVTIKR